MVEPYLMKLYLLSTCIGVVALLQGCASYQDALVLDLIGPPPGPMANTGRPGTLLVFSAFDVHAHFNDSPYERLYSDYKIFSDDGKILQVVHNNVSGTSGGPKPIELPQGRYRVVARANGYGWVTVPLLIETHKLTTVHLEGGTSWKSIDGMSTNAVRLPDGQIAGWRAN